MFLMVSWWYHGDTTFDMLNCCDLILALLTELSTLAKVFGDAAMPCWTCKIFSDDSSSKNSTMRQGARISLTKWQKELEKRQPSHKSLAVLVLRHDLLICMATAHCTRYFRNSWVRPDFLMIVGLCPNISISESRWILQEERDRQYWLNWLRFGDWLRLTGDWKQQPYWCWPHCCFHLGASNGHDHSKDLWLAPRGLAGLKGVYRFFRYDRNIPVIYQCVPYTPVYRCVQCTRLIQDEKKNYPNSPTDLWSDNLLAHLGPCESTCAGDQQCMRQSCEWPPYFKLKSDDTNMAAWLKTELRWITWQEVFLLVITFNGFFLVL